MIIKNVHIYNDCLVTNGRLVTVKQNTKSRKRFDVIKVEKEYVISGLDVDDIEEAEIHKLYIISGTEKIETGDKVYERNLSNECIYEVYLREYKNKLTNGIFRFDNVFVPLEKTNCKKIIVFHEQFTNELIERLITYSNYLDIYGEVLVVCESSYVLDGKHLPYPHEKESEHCYIIKTINYYNHIQLLLVPPKTKSFGFNPRKHRTRPVCEGAKEFVELESKYNRLKNQFNIVDIEEVIQDITDKYKILIDVRVEEYLNKNYYLIKKTNKFL